MLKRTDFIYKEKMFDFDKYPMLEKEFEKFKKLDKKVLKLSMGKGELLNEAYKELCLAEIGELSRLVFDTFHGKVDYVVYDATEKKSWAEMFGDDWEKLDDNHKKCLTWLLDGGFIYCLPDEYYVSPVEFFDRESRQKQ